MSKGNLFQGQGRGKVGDVVFTVRNGEQVGRVRNRHPYNPRSPRQLVQRAIMATVSLAYSAGREIFDHSFEGFAAGDACARYFLKQNARKLRSDIAQQLNLSPQEATAACVAPNAKFTCPNEYMVSKGSLSNIAKLSFAKSSNNIYYWQVEFPSPNLNESLGQYVTRNFKPTDLFTLVCFNCSTQYEWKAEFKIHADLFWTDRGTENTEYETFPVNFSFIRFAIKPEAFTSQSQDWSDEQTHIKWSDILDITDYKGESLITDETSIQAVMSGKVTEPLDVNGFFNWPNYRQGQPANGAASMAIIRSRVNEDLRSTEYMVNANNNNRTAGSMYAPQGGFGITAPLVLTAWQQETTIIGDSDLILEGGDGE